ncbi:unnamed protein product, partial [Closterium sp. NIES-54]
MLSSLHLISPLPRTARSSLPFLLPFSSNFLFSSLLISILPSSSSSPLLSSALLSSFSSLLFLFPPLPLQSSSSSLLFSCSLLISSSSSLVSSSLLIFSLLFSASLLISSSSLVFLSSLLLLSFSTPKAQDHVACAYYHPCMYLSIPLTLPPHLLSPPAPTAVRFHVEQHAKCVGHDLRQHTLVAASYAAVPTSHPHPFMLDIS